MSTGGGALWGVAVALMVAVLLVLNVVRMRRSGQFRRPVLTVVVTVAAVLLLVGLVLAFGQRP